VRGVPLGEWYDASALFINRDRYRATRSQLPKFPDHKINATVYAATNTR
jgi:hypothetical protein